MNKVTGLLLGSICLLLMGSAGATVLASTTVNMYPNFNAGPSSDTGCAALTSAVSSATGALDSTVPTPYAYSAIDQEDTSYNSGASGASFCSYDYTGTTMALTSASATLFLMESGPSTDSWPVTVSLYDLTSCTTYTAEAPCTPIASGSATLTGVINDANLCYNSEMYSIALTPSGSASLTSGHLYGLVVSADSSDSNGFNRLELCTGAASMSADPTMVSLTGGPSPVMGVPQFPYGMAVIVGVSMVALSLLSRRASAKSALPSTQ